MKRKKLRNHYQETASPTEAWVDGYERARTCDLVVGVPGHRDTVANALRAYEQRKHRAARAGEEDDPDLESRCRAEGDQAHAVLKALCEDS